MYFKSDNCKTFKYQTVVARGNLIFENHTMLKSYFAITIFFCSTLLLSKIMLAI